MRNEKIETKNKKKNNKNNGKKKKKKKELQPTTKLSTYVCSAQIAV